MGYGMPQALFLYVWLFCVVAANSCLYFRGSNFSNQFLLIRRERVDNYCQFNQTEKSVTCKGNETATRINDTHILLNTEEKVTNVNFILSYGENGNGKSAYPYEAACPDSPVVPENQEKTAEHSYPHYGVYVAISLGIVVVVIIIIIIYKKCKKRKKDETQRNGGSSVYKDVTYTNGRQVEIIEHA